MKEYTPKEIVSELDRFIIGQTNAKKAVAIALRNRWRRQQVTEKLREEILPKNILMIGPTGVGKTEISRRLAKLANAPFIKVEATKFTEIGYVGRDVEQIIRDLLEVAITLIKKQKRQEVKSKAKLAAEERLLNTLVGENATTETREKFRKILREGKLDNKLIEINVTDTGGAQIPTIDIPGMPGAHMGMINIGEILGKSFNAKKKNVKVKTSEAFEIFIAEESDKLIDQDLIIKEAIHETEQNGIVFLDEIDKICLRNERQGGDISREGVQRDLLPLIEGTSVSTKHGSVKTDHILFVASGAFHLSKPSDLLPELQGRLPIRVELNALSQTDLSRILTETEASLIKQYKALLKTEEVTLKFTKDSINEISSTAAEVNQNVENIGARRLQTILEKLLEEISFSACENSGKTITINQEYVKKTVGHLAKSTDLSKFIL